MKNNNLRFMESNILSWYDFKKESKILYYGNKENGVYRYLEENNKYVKSFQENTIKEEYDYIVILDSEIKMEEILDVLQYLKDTGILLIAFDNSYGISNFITYHYDSRISPLEKITENKISKFEIEEELELKGYQHKNSYMAFPNIKNVDLILGDKLDDFSKKIDKYFPEYREESVILVDEISTLKKIAKVDRELFIKLSNSYLLEFSKKPIKNEIKYVSYNNYRKDEYMLTTIIKEDIVEKKPTTQDAKNNIKRIAMNLEYLNKYEFEILDKFENNTLYSNFIKDTQTLDIELANAYNDFDFIMHRLNEIKEILLKNSLEYNPKDRKCYISILKETEEVVLKKFHYLEHAFYDMIPKNCFYLNRKYYFFDQEWMEKYLPVEFIIYRGIINSSDLVKKINVDDLLEKMGLKEYKDLFDKIDQNLRDKIVNEDYMNYLNKQHKKMYEIIYEHGVLQKENEMYKINNIKQDEYIKYLEGRNNTNELK